MKTKTASESYFQNDPVIVRRSKQSITTALFLAAAFITTIATGIIFHQTHLDHFGRIHAISGIVCIALVTKQIQILARLFYHKIKLPIA